jgi:L-lactate utilization protein LutB
MNHEAKWLEQRQRWHHERLAEKAIQSLEKNNFSTHYFSSSEEARTGIMEMIPDGCSVGWGGSVTLYNMGILYDIQKSGKYECHNPFQNFVSEDQPHLAKTVREDEGRLRMRKQMRETMLVDVYLTGTNAITLDGELVNVDGMGNRVAAMLFGPWKVIVVGGANKIVSDLKTAMKRIKDMAAPMTAKMLGHDTPCTKIGTCVPAKGGHCYHPHRICCGTVTINGQYDKDRIHVVIVGDELGF